MTSVTHSHILWLDSSSDLVTGCNVGFKWLFGGKRFLWFEVVGFFSSFDKSFDNGLSSWGAAALSGSEAH